LHGTASASTSTLLTLRSTISVAALDDGAVLLDLESKYFYALNGSGWAIVQLFESNASVEQATQHARTWGAPGDDVAAFLERLLAYDLLEPAAAPAVVPETTFSGPWSVPTIERQAEPLQNVMVSAFDPSIPLAE
jgi:hypothetical protein